MTTATTYAATTQPSAPAPVTRVHARPSFAGTVRAETVKLLSLRSTWWTVAATVVVMTLLGLAQSASLEYIAEDAPGLPLHGAEFVAGGYQFGMVTVAVLGALLVTGEYSTGMIRSTFQAVPDRLPVLAAKAVALVVMTVAVTALALTGSFLVSAPHLAAHDLVPALDDSTTWQVFGGVAFLFVTAALLALGMGALLRSTAGTITGVLGLLLLLPVALQFVTVGWVQDVMGYLPLPAAVSFLGVTGTFGSNDALSPWQGVAVLGAYAAAALVAGSVRVRLSDA